MAKNRVPNAEWGHERGHECDTSVTRVKSWTLRRSSKEKCTVQHSSVDFAICRVCKGHYELPKNRWHIDVRRIWVGEKIFFRSVIFSKKYFFDKKNRKIELKKNGRSKKFFLTDPKILDIDGPPIFGKFIVTLKHPANGKFNGWVKNCAFCLRRSPYWKGIRFFLLSPFVIF